MRMMIRLFMIACAVVLVSSCQHTDGSYGDEQQKADKKISAAKINTRLGMAYLERHQVERAKQKFLLALKLAPSIPETWYSMAYFMETTGNKEEANSYYKKAVALNPSRGDSLNNYGTFLCREGDYAKAIGYFQQAAADPDYLEASAAYENAGFCSMQDKSNDDAIGFFNKAIKQDSRRPKSLLALAQLYYQKHAYEQSLTVLNDYYLIAQGTKESDQLLNRLKRLNMKFDKESYAG